MNKTLIAFLCSLILSGAIFAQNLPTIPLHLEVPIAPMPFTTDGKTHLLYELHITSFRTTAVELVQIDVFGDMFGSKSLAGFNKTQLTGILETAGISKKAANRRIIKPGER